MSSTLDVRRIRDRAGFDALEKDWLALAERSDVASPFLTPGWQAAWLDTYGRAHELFVLAVYRDAALVGLWPLARIRRGPWRVLEPVGAGRSDWLDILTTAEDRDAVFAACVAHLMAARGEWDLIELRDVLANSPSLAAFDAIAGATPLRVRREVRTAAPQLSLAGSWEQFLATKRAKFRTNIKYYRRVAEKAHPSFTLVKHAWNDNERVVDRLAEVELRSWKAREGNLKISTDVGREFYHRFMSYFAQRGELDLWRADGSDKLLAFLVNIRFGGKVYHYNTCFDEAASAISPGMLMHSEAIQEAFAQGMSEYDFLSGDEPYKDRWCSGRRDILHVALFRGGLRSRLAFFQLVDARWRLRRSKWLRETRQKMLALVRRSTRGKDKDKAEGAE
jgi:CelD/BcsL family acetyltransferase involved in cellulose biosynthesis